MSENGQPKVVATFTFILFDNNAVATDCKGPFPGMMLNLAMDVHKARMTNDLLQSERRAILEQQQAQQKRVLMADGSVPPPGL